MTLTSQQLNESCPYALPTDLKAIKRYVSKLEPHLEFVMLGAGPGVFALAILEEYGEPTWMTIVDHDTLQWVEAHLKAAGLLGRVGLVKADSVEYAQHYDGYVDFLVIDADHTYEGVKRDIQAWWPLVERGGLVYFHDYVATEPDNGVKQAIDELKNSNWEEIEQVGWGILFKKVK